MNNLKPLLILPAAIFAFASCAYLATPQGHALLTTGETIAQVALEAAATSFGGPLAGQLAHNGLDALASVLQGYVGTTVPEAIVVASPGVKGVGPAVAPLISKHKAVTQADVNALYKAAELAAKEDKL